MAVTSTTLAGVNVWKFSGAVTDAELKAAWAALIVNNRYKPGRYIYIDSTCSLVNVRGTYYVDCEAFGIILHSSRNKANTLFSNWIFTQTVGLSVGARSNFVRVTNGSTITTTLTDGIDMKGGGMIYAVVGNPGGGDPRYLNEMMFGSLDGTVITSQAFTEQELQPVSYGTIWRGLNIQKCANIPIVNSGNQVVYRANFNTETTIANPISLYSGSNGCFVSTVMRKQGATFTSSLANTYASGGVTTIVILNNWKDESYFGASKTNLTCANWSATNKIVGGVLKKILVQPSTLIRTYDSRSTTASQKSTFSETTNDFLSGTDSTTSDSTTGKASIVCVGAIATGGSVAITRYTGQKFTLQKFGYKVQIETPDMTFGDDDLSAFSPITMPTQDGIVRTQAAINAATTIDSFQQLLEELHVLAIGLVGAASYNGFNSGNLFNFSGGVLTTNFTTVNVDATAASKITYNSATNALTIKSSVLGANSTVARWNNASGIISLVNGAVIQGVYQSSAGISTTINIAPVEAGSSVLIFDTATGTTKLFEQNATAGTKTLYLPPLSAATYRARVRSYLYQDFYEDIAIGGGGEVTIVPKYAEDVGVVNTSQSAVAAYTTIDNHDEFRDRAKVYGLTEAGMKLNELAVRNGTSIDILAGYNGEVDENATTAFNVTSGLITIKTAEYRNGTRFINANWPPPATFTAKNTEVLFADFADANGDSSITIQGGSGSFALYRFDITSTAYPSAGTDERIASGNLVEALIGNGKYRFTASPNFNYAVQDLTQKILLTCQKRTRSILSLIKWLSATIALVCIKVQNLHLSHCNKMRLLS